MSITHIYERQQEFLKYYDYPPQFHKCLTVDCKNKTVNEYCRECTRKKIKEEKVKLKLKPKERKVDIEKVIKALTPLQMRIEKAQDKYREHIKTRAENRLKESKKEIVKYRFRDCDYLVNS